MNDKFLSMCGLARRAGRVIIGTDMSTVAIRGKNKPYLVVLSVDASENSKKRIDDACAYHEVKLVKSTYTKNEIGDAVGQKGGAACIAITDEGFAQTLCKLYYDRLANQAGSQEVK